MLHNILDILNFKNTLKLIVPVCSVAAKIVITYVVHILSGSAALEDKANKTDI